MAYPVVAAPYGLKPINLIGAQHHAGGVRHLPIQYGYNSNIFNGDFVKLAAFGSAGGAGLLNRAAISAATTANQITGVFVGVSYSSPTTRQLLFNQWWPAGTLAAGDAYVVDDPDTLFKAAVCSAGLVMASANWSSLGANMAMINNINTPSSLVNGNSTNAVLAGSETTGAAPVRIVDLVPETSVPTVVHGSSATTVLTLTDVGGLPRAIPIGTDVSYFAGNGQIIRTGSYVSVAAAVGATTLTLSIAPAAGNVATPIPAGSTIILTIYPEVILKIDHGFHGYYSNTAV